MTARKEKDPHGGSGDFSRAVEEHRRCQSLVEAQKRVIAEIRAQGDSTLEAEELLAHHQRQADRAKAVVDRIRGTLPHNPF